jgi:hypothetical protein
MRPDVDADVLRFDPLQHRYWIGTRELVSVTRILQDAGLVETTWYTETARDRGTAVHRAAEAMDRDHAIGAGAPDIEPYLCAYQRFLQEARPVWHGIETAAADPCLGYAGTIDRWGTLQGEPVVVDLKTGAIPPWAPLQLVAYARLVPGHPQDPRRRRLVVHLLPTGRYSVREYPLVNFGRDERVFLAALTVAQWKRAA